jgi:UPF0755 protein
MLLQFLNRSPFARLFVAGLFLLIFTLGVRTLQGGVESAPDFELGIAGPEVLVEVLDGETGSAIGQKLEELGVVKSSLAFFRVAVADPRSARIAPGQHRVETKIPAKVALEQLLDSERIPNLIVIRDGARLSEISESIIKFGVTEKELREALSNLEGVLYPAMYSFTQGTEATQILNQMLQKFQWATEGIDWGSLEGFSANEVLTIASLVESEGTPDVFGNVARVIFNRLQIGMPLQFDSTVHYALDRRGEIRVSLKETKVASKYNTFLNRGLPPGPIGSPTRAAFDATLNPPQGDWLYFVTVKPGETRFTSSYETFLEWKAEYKANFRKGLFE